MKPILVAALAALSLTTAQAVEYKMLTGENREVQFDPTSLVEIVGLGGSGSLDNVLVRFFDGPTSEDFKITSSLSKLTKGAVITGMTRVQFLGLSGNGQPFVSLKITKASEINAVTPGAVLVLPETSTGNYDVVIEASDDLISWIPFFSQTVNSQAAKKFFRTRVVRSVAPVQKP